MVQNLHTFFSLSKEIKRSPNIKPQTKVFSSASNLNIRQAKNNIGSRLESCSWPPAVLKSNIRLSPNSTLVNNFSGRRLCLPYNGRRQLSTFRGRNHVSKYLTARRFYRPTSLFPVCLEMYCVLQSNTVRRS